MSQTLPILALLLNKLQDISGQTEVRVDIPPDLKFGDLTTNVAMLAAQQNKADPLTVAAEYYLELIKDPVLKKNFSKIEVVRPGFINFYYSDEVVKRELEKNLNQPGYGRQNIGKNRRVVIEYSSPNTNKPLHLGHLRNNIIGMALANIHEFMGYQVIKTQVVNDRGVHIMKSLWAYQQYGQGKTPKKTGVKGDKFVGDYYVKYNQAEQADPSLKTKIQQMLLAWEQGDKEIRKVWQQLNSWVYDGWQQTYELIGSEFDRSDYESELYDQGREIVKQAVKNQLAYQNKDKATVIDLSPYNLGGRTSGEKILLRSDGTTVYITQDLYLAVERQKKYKFDKMIYVVGDEQIYHFQVLFKILELLNYDWMGKLFHYYYGQVFLPGGKMKSREGTVVDIDDLLLELQQTAVEEIRKRTDKISSSELAQRSWTIALAAVKYWFLKTNPHSKVVYNPKESLDFEGNTGPYLLYTYVRLKSILAKSNFKKFIIKEKFKLPVAETNLVRLMLQWPYEIKRLEKDLNLNDLCKYAYRLAGEFNAYYHKHPVLQCPDPDLQNCRLQIIKSGSRLLETILQLLNIKTINKM